MNSNQPNCPINIRTIITCVFMLLGQLAFADECKLDIKKRADYEKGVTYDVWYTQIMMDIELINVHRLGLEGNEEDISNAEYRKRLKSTIKHLSDNLSSKDPCVQLFLNRDFMVFDKTAKKKENSIGYLMARYIEEFGGDLNR